MSERPDAREEYFVRHQGASGLSADVVPASPPGRFPGLDADHPAVGNTCPICGQPLRAGDAPALVNPHPTNAADAERAERGAAYTARVDLAHERCAYPEGAS